MALDAADSTHQAPQPRWWRLSAPNRYGLTLVLLLATYVQTLAIRNDAIGWSSVIVLQLLTVYLVLSVSGSTRIRRLAAITFVAAGAVFALLALFGPRASSDEVLFALFLINIALYAVAPLVIIRHIFFRGVVDRQTFLGAVSAYVMIGMMFAFVYSAVAIMAPDPFFTSDPANPTAAFLFFSFVTITTTGYGDLIPAGEIGQTLAVWEALIGQFFLAAVVAKIVSAWRPSQAGTKVAVAPTADDGPADVAKQ